MRLRLLEVAFASQPDREASFGENLESVDAFLGARSMLSSEGLYGASVQDSGDSLPCWIINDDTNWRILPFPLIRTELAAQYPSEI